MNPQSKHVSVSNPDKFYIDGNIVRVNPQLSDNTKKETPIYHDNDNVPNIEFDNELLTDSPGPKRYISPNDPYNQLGGHRRANYSERV